MARKRTGSIDSDDSTNARAERRAKRTQFLGTRLRGRTDSCYGRAVLYFIGLWPQVPKGSNQWLVINKDASNPDEKYWLSAAVDLAILAAIIFFFIWAEKSLRRARKQRRSESADDDVESGARSPQ